LSHGSVDADLNRCRQCDEAKPTCSQCVKSKRQCPGYKDDFELILRNETTATARRASRPTNRKQKSRTPSSSSGSSPDSASSPPGRRAGRAQQKTTAEPDRSGSGKEYGPQDSIIPAIKIPIEIRASCHFVSNFVLVPRKGSTRGYMDYLIPLMRQAEESKGHQQLQHAFNACALASLGNKSKGLPVGSGGLDLNKEAFREYTKALATTNEALRDPIKCKHDTVLAAVLLLGMFEVCRGFARLSWTTRLQRVREKM